MAYEKDAVKAGELTEKEAEARMVTFRKEAGARDKKNTDYNCQEAQGGGEGKYGFSFVLSFIISIDFC